MNKAILIGRLTADPELRETQGGKSVSKFTLAVDRLKKEDGADFISCTAWGKTAENLCKFMRKGSKVSVVGRIETGSYEKDGRRIYTTDVIASELEFLESKKKEESEDFAEVPDTVSDDDLPF